MQRRGRNLHAQITFNTVVHFGTFAERIDFAQVTLQHQAVCSNKLTELASLIEFRSGMVILRVTRADNDEHVIIDSLYTVQVNLRYTARTGVPSI